MENLSVDSKENMKSFQECSAFKKVLYDESYIPTVIVDLASLRIFDCNDAALKIYGAKSKEEMLTKTVYDFSDPIQENGITLEEKIENTIVELSEKGFQIGEWKKIGLDGRMFYAEIQVVLFIHDDRKYAFYMLKDITEEKKSRKELLKQKRILSNVIEGTNAGTWEWNIPERMNHINARYAEMLGYKYEELAPITTEKLLYLMHPDDLPVVKKELELNYTKQKDFYDTEFRVKTKSGEWMWINSHGKILEWSDDGQPIIMSGINIDINARKKHEEEVLKLNNQLEEKVKERTNELEEAHDRMKKSLDQEKIYNDMKTRFINMISHEYRTPLTVIQSSSEVIDLMVKKNDTSNVPEFIKKINNSILALNNLLSDIITFSMEGEEISVVASPVELIGLADSIIEEINVMDKLGHQIVLESSEDFLSVFTDQRLLTQILKQLLKNSVKYSPKDSKITLSICNNDNQIQFKVIDQGVGISDEDMKHLFEPFFREKSSIGIKDGTGLGLAIVKKYSDLLGAEISIESKLSKGTTFTVSLPL